MVANCHFDWKTCEFWRWVERYGKDLGEARYSILEGRYRFAVTEEGWDLFREKDVDDAALAVPTLTRSLKKNALPAIPSSAPLAN